eukprot:Tamp_16018.p1 GENE.Tamp_16018~~Tamp_16018.p1  ORF type:complete len:495 (+),score=46.36 Tamp_16018:132-1487(+)
MDAGQRESANVPRRSALSHAAAVGVGALAGAAVTAPGAASAAISADAEWPLWPALPVAPYSRRKTVRREVGPNVWAFDQFIGIYYVHVPIRMTVIAMESGGLFVYAPVAATRECLALLQPLIDAHGPVKHIVLPAVAVEHKVLAGPFARRFPDAEFYAVDQQYSFPLPLPNSFLGLPSWTKALPASSKGLSAPLFGGEFDFEVLTVNPGPVLPGREAYQDAAFVHKPSKTLVLCDTIWAVTEEPPPILMSDPEYRRAMLFHARDKPTQIVEESPEALRKGWKRIVLLFNFFIPGSTLADAGLGPVLAALKTPSYELGWGGWQPFNWDSVSVDKSFEVLSANGKAAILPIIQIIISRAPEATRRWVKAVEGWDFERVIPAHLDAPLAIGPQAFAQTFAFLEKGTNSVRFCDEDVALLRNLEAGILQFSVYKSELGYLRGRPCGLSGKVRKVK